MTNTRESKDTVLFADLPKVDGLLGPFDISTEQYREYVQANGDTYRIDDPIALYRREGGATHRVVDINGVVHCVPCGALHPHTVIRWKNINIYIPVNF